MKQEQEIFEQAIALPSREAREGFLVGACGQNRELRRSVEELLAAFNDAGELAFLQTGDRSQEAQTVRADAQPHEQPGHRIGRYKLLQPIGDGGCGIVYMAEPEEPVRRRVALKVIKLGMDTKSVVARFEAERQALALMDHPNIAKVLDAGATETGRPYFVMELVRGVKITEYCDQHNLPTRERLDLFIKVCQAIQHAHQKGIIHRDIKPSNILVTLHDGVAVPKVIDFGIAKATTGQRLTDKTLFTALEQFIGTPAYMSPEQAEMSGLDVDTRCDIYSLGVLLYEMLTGKTPFDAKELLASGLDEMRRTIREKEPVRPSTKLSQTLVAANVSSLGSSGTKPTTEEEVRADSRRLLRLKETIPLLRGDVDWIVMKCLEKDRTRRYETANGLASDIQRHLNNEAVLARPPSAAYRFQKLVQRNKATAAAAAAIASVLVLGTAISTWQAIRATRAQHQALDAQQKEAKQHRLTDEALALALRNAYAAEMSLAFEALERGHFGGARELLIKQQKKESADLRGWEWRHLWQRTKGDELFTLRGHSNVVSAALFLSDGRTIVSAGGDGTLRFWDVDLRTNIQTFPTGGFGCLALSPNGRWLAKGGWHCTLFDMTTRQRVYVETNSQAVAGLAFSADGQRLAIADGRNVTLLELAMPRTLKTMIRSSGTVDGAHRIGLAFSPDGATLAYCHADDTIRLYDIASHSERILPSAGHGEALSLVFSGDGRLLVSADYGGISVWEVAVTNLLKRLTNHRAEVTCVAFSPDGRSLASASSDQTIKRWDTRTWTELETFHGHEMEALSVAFSLNGELLVSCGWDESLRVWDLRPSSRPRQHFRSAENAPLNWPFPHGDRLVLVHGNLPYAVPAAGLPESVREALRLHGDYGAVSYLNCVTLEETPREQTPPSFSSARLMAFGPNANSVAVGWPGGKIEFWTTQPFRKVRVVSESGDAPENLALAESGELLSVQRANGTVEIWDLRTGALLRQLPRLAGTQTGPSNCGFSAHDHILGRVTAQGVLPSLIELWPLPEGSRRVFAHPKGAVRYWAVSNNGRLLATSSWDGSLRLWDVASEQQIAMIREQLKTYLSLTFSPDDSKLLGGGYDGTITVWDLSTPQAPRRVARWKAHAGGGHGEGCVWLRFVGGDGTLFSLGDCSGSDRWQGDLRLWRAPSLSEIDAQPRNP